MAGGMEIDERRIFKLVGQLKRHLASVKKYCCAEGCFAGQDKADVRDPRLMSICKRDAAEDLNDLARMLYAEDHEAQKTRRKVNLAFVVFGGTSVLIDFLFCTIPKEYGGHGKTLPQREMQNDMNNLWYGALEILRDVSIANFQFLAELGTRRDILVLLLNMLKHPPIFSAAVALCEEIVYAPGGVQFDLGEYPDLNMLIEKFDAKQLAVFCRVLSFLVHEHENVMGEPPVSLQLLCSRARSLNTGSISQRNQIRMVMVPGLLQKLVHVLRGVATKSQKRNERATQSNNQTGINNVGDIPPQLLPTMIAQRRISMEDLLTWLQQNVDSPEQRMEVGETLVALLENHMGLGMGTVTASSSASRGQASGWTSMPEPIPVEQLYHECNLEGDDARAKANRHLVYDESKGIQCAQLERKVYLDDSLGDVLNVKFPTSHLAKNVKPASSTMGATGVGRSAEGDGEGNTAWRTALQRQAFLEQFAQTVEILYVLAILTTGKCKEEVSTKLASYGLLPMLLDLFNTLDWAASSEEEDGQHIHGENCDCSPNSALKIQFLRLVHNFCDREKKGRRNQRLLLSPVDIHSCEKLNHAMQHDNLGMIKETLIDIRLEFTTYQNDKSLLFLLVQLLKNENPDSKYQFWLASTIESFLRGGSKQEQLLLTCWGLLEHILGQLLQCGYQNAGMLQTNFDLLSELIKFNPYQFKLMESIMTIEQHRALMDLAMSFLVDSNVFIRTLFLSLEKFEIVDPEFAQSTPFYALVQEIRLPFLRNLMTVVTFETISQDNVCCLNTALLILMFANWKNTLPQTLEAVRASKEDEDPCINYRKLLWFWRHYYLNFNEQDRQSLSLSSGIAFEYWIEITNILCQDDGSPVSLLKPGQIVQHPTILDISSACSRK